MLVCLKYQYQFCNQCQKLMRNFADFNGQREQRQQIGNFEPQNYQQVDADEYNRHQNDHLEYDRSERRDHEDSYFYELEEYSPLPCGPILIRDCDGDPLFLANKGWWKSFLVILGFNFLFGLALVTFVVDDTKHPSTTNTGKGRQHILKILCIVTLSITNIFYLLAQFMNPGIRHPKRQQEAAQGGQSYCSECRQYRGQKMEHCRDCQVCIWGFDHHCGFFSKCIGGYQKFAFYGFLVGMFGSFMVLLASMSWELGL